MKCTIGKAHLFLWNINYWLFYKGESTEHITHQCLMTDIWFWLKRFLPTLLSLHARDHMLILGCLYYTFFLSRNWRWLILVGYIKWSRETVFKLKSLSSILFFKICVGIRAYRLKGWALVSCGYFSGPEICFCIKDNKNTTTWLLWD